MIGAEVRPGLLDAVASEWLKVRTLRSTAWSIAATVVLSVGLCIAVTSVYTADWSHLSASDRQQVLLDPIALILQPGLQWGQVAVCVLAVLTMTGEFGTGAIRSSLLAVPTRTPLLAAKAVVVGVVTLALGELISFGSFTVGASIVSRRVAVSLTDAGVLRAVMGAGVALAVAALLALGVATLARGTAAAITVVIVLVVVLPQAAGLLPVRIGEELSTYLPGGQAGQMIVSSGRGADFVVGPWTGLAIAVGWTMVTLVLAGFVLRRRDV